MNSQIFVSASFMTIITMEFATQNTGEIKSKKAMLTDLC